MTSVLFPSLLAALLTVTVWKVLTGGLHLDGLADCLDGLVGKDAEHRLSIMRDSRIGAFGAVGLILFLLLEIAAVAELPSGLRWRALLVLPALARATAPLLARCFPPAKVEGHGAAFRSGLRAGAVPVALALALALVWVGLGVAGLLGAGTALVAAFALTGFMAVNRARLKTLSGEKLAEMARSDELELLYAHLHSMRNFVAMRERFTAPAAKLPEAAAASTASEADAKVRKSEADKTSKKR